MFHHHQNVPTLSGTPCPRTMREQKEKLDKKAEDPNDGDVFEKVLAHVGEMGTYQKWLFLVTMPLGVTLSFVYFVQMFAAATPQQHWCQVPELQHLDMEMRRNLSAPGAAQGVMWDRCATYDVNWTMVLETMKLPDPSTPTIPCQDGWEYELSDIPYHTVVSERGWVCDNASYGPTAQTMFFVGSFVGGLLFGWLADRFGRVPGLIAANLIGCIGGVASTFTTGLWDFAFCRFLAGISFDSSFMLMYILLLEYVGPSYRTRVATLSIALYCGTGGVILPWLAFWIKDWRALLVATSLPMLVVIAAPCAVPESARWLSSRGRISEAVDIFMRFERVNGTKIPPDVIDEFVHKSNQKSEADESFTALLKSKELRVVMFQLLFVDIACAIILDGLVRMSDNLGLDFFFAFTLSAITDIPAVIFLTFVLDRWGRRILTCTPMAFAGSLSIIGAFVSKGAPQATLAIIARFFMNMSLTASMQRSTELLPTAVRASGSSVIRVTSFVAASFSPFIVFSERYWSPLPLLIMGVVTVLASVVGMFLPETMGRPLPQTIAEGEKLAREHTLCGKPED